MFHKERVLVTGGTGTIGSALIRELLSSDYDPLGPQLVRILSRDEEKQAKMKRELAKDGRVEFRLGDVRCFESVASALAGIDVVFHTAALKSVPACEDAPIEAVMTNLIGTENVVRAIERQLSAPRVVVGCSTDKACHPSSVMGATKFVQEQLLVSANRRCRSTRFAATRFGNLVASRGSAVPLFLSQIAAGGPVTITDRRMTRFFVTLDRAVKTLLETARVAGPGEIYVPAMKAATIESVAKTLIGDRAVPIELTGIRAGEKIHEGVVSPEEARRTVKRGDYYVILPADRRPLESFFVPPVSNEALMSDFELKEMFQV